MRLCTSPCRLSTTVVGIEETRKKPPSPSSYRTSLDHFWRSRNGFTSARSSSVAMDRKTTSALSLNLCLTCSYNGCWARHGPHQVAQKSSTTTLPLRLLIASWPPSTLVRVNSSGDAAALLGSKVRRRRRRASLSGRVRAPGGSTRQL